MSKRVSFKLNTAGDFKLNGGLKDSIRFSEKRYLQVTASNRFHSDFDGDGIQDDFVLNIRRGDVNVECLPSKNLCTLFLPNGKDDVAKMMPGYANGNAPADFFIETKDGKKMLLQHQMEKHVLPARSEADYEQHLKRVKTVAAKNWNEGLLSSIRYNLGLTHTWVVPQVSADPLTWVNAQEPYTDCVFELERVLAELHSNGSIGNFKEVFHNVQYYDRNEMPERADFMSAEALPHLERSGFLSDETHRLFGYISSGRKTPTFKVKIDKEAWYKGQHDGQASGKNFLPQQLDLSYMPFENAVTVQPSGNIQVNPRLAKALPQVSVILVMNKDRYFDKLGTDIPESHVAFLIKGDKKFKIIHSTPTTDLGIAAVTTEDFETFMKVRYIKVENGSVVNNGKDPTAIGFKILFFDRLHDGINHQ